MPRILFPDFRPDAAEGFDSPFCSVASNVVPIEDGYGPAKGFTPISVPLGDTCRGAFEAIKADGTKVVFAFTPTAAKMLEGTTWADVSGPSAPYTATEWALWVPTQYLDYVIAANPNVTPQRYDLASGGAFDDLGGTPPQAAIAGVNDQFTFLIGGLGSLSRQVAHSGIADPDEWDTINSLASVQQLADGDLIVGAAFGETVLVWQADRLRRAVRSGGSFAYAIEVLDSGRGLAGPYAVAVANNAAYYLGNDGFYRTTFSGQTTPIGAGRVNRWFLSRVSQANLKRIQAASHPKYPRILWAYNTGSGEGYNEILVYDWMLDRWAGPITIGVQYLFPVTQPGVSLDDALLNQISIDEMTVSLDDPQYAEGEKVMGAIDSLGRFGILEGAFLEATIETGAVLDPSGQRKRARTAYPVLQGDLDCTVAIGTRDRPSDTETWSAASAPNTMGLIRLPRPTGRAIRARMTIAAGASWTKAQGVDLELVGAGRR